MLKDDFSLSQAQGETSVEYLSLSLSLSLPLMCVCEGKIAQAGKALATLA